MESLLMVADIAFVLAGIVFFLLCLPEMWKLRHHTIMLGFFFWAVGLAAGLVWAISIFSLVVIGHLSPLGCITDIFLLAVMIWGWKLLREYRKKEECK